MRKIVWIQGSKEFSEPELKKFADAIKGELVKFGETSHAVIGNEFSEQIMKALDEHHNKSLHNAFMYLTEACKSYGL